MPPPVLRFLPWARQGLAQGIANPDNPGGTLPARTSIQVGVEVAGTPATARIDLYGPGEVTGIDRRQILRTEPRPGATDFEPNYLASIDLDPPDFPWLFTPAGQKSGRLQPWCVLAAVERGPGVNISVRSDAPLPVLTIAAPAIASRELPDLVDSWAWAHTQLLEQPGAGDDFESDPDGTLSRLVCPRKLEPQTRYFACVVPAFDLGVRRGLGRPATEAVAQPAWDLRDTTLDSDGISLPLYYFWEFATAVEDDAESMARRLHGPERAPTDLGRRRIYAAAGHAGLARPALPAAARVVTMEGALRPAEGGGSTPAPAQASQLTTRLAGIVGRRDTPELPAPLYGEWPAEQHRLQNAPVWFSELNTTVANRIAAALGTEVVRRNQEAFVDAAWQQVGEVLEANRLAQRARLAAAALERLVARHFVSRPAGRLLQLAGPMLARTSVAPAGAGAAMRTIAAELDDASLPAGAASAAYRRLVSAQRQAVKRARRAGLVHRESLIAATATRAALVEPDPGPPDGITSLRDRDRLRPSGKAQSVSLAPLGLAGETTVSEVEKLAPVRGPVGPLPTTVDFFPQSQLTALVLRATGRVTKLPPPGPLPTPTRVTQTGSLTMFRTAFRTAAEEVNGETARADFVAADVAGLGGRLLTRLDAKANVARRVRAMVTGPGAGPTAFDPYDGIQAFPVLNDSTFQYLDQLDGGWMLPEANGLEPDTAILLRTNPEFTSAFLVGLNHEMNSELLWRGYPTDQRGTPFQHFWDRLDDRPDILPMHQWNATLPLETAGAPPTTPGTGEQIVLLLRGTLLRRYPDLVIYATVGSRTAPGATVPAAGRPMFSGQLRPDMDFVGFPLTPAELASAEWWFVLEQQLTAPRLGFDLGPVPPVADQRSWSDATWSMFDDIADGAYIVLQDRTVSPPKDTKIATTIIAGRRFGSTADQVAISLLQRPVRVALHKDRLLLHPGGGT